MDNSQGKKSFLLLFLYFFFLLMFSLREFEAKTAGLMQKSQLSSQ